MNLETSVDPKYDGLSHGIDNKKIAATLRSMADDIDGGRITPEEVRLVQRLSTETIYFQTLIVRFYEKVTAAPSPPTIDG